MFSNKLYYKHYSLATPFAMDCNRPISTRNKKEDNLFRLSSLWRCVGDSNP